MDPHATPDAPDGDPPLPDRHGAMPPPAALATDGAASADDDTETAVVRGPGTGTRTLRDRPRRTDGDHTLRQILLGFLAVLAAGTVLLMLPWATADGSIVSPLTAFFTATSALTGTGLVVVDTGTSWSAAGQAVIGGLILLGGIGIIASTGLVLVVLGRRTDLRSRLAMAGVSGSALGDARSIVLRTTVYVVTVTLLGALVLTLLFWVRGQAPLEAAWWGLFHANSAFNNAGFDLTGGFQGFTPFAQDPGIVLVTTGLMLLGSLGLLAVTEVWQRRSLRGLSVESRLVLLTSGVLVIAGALGYLLIEWSNPATFGALPPFDRLTNALFTSVSARSTGMNTVDIAALRPESQTMTTMLMFIGGAVGSTAGGIRVTTFAILVIVTVSMLRRREEPEALGRRLAPRTVYLALTLTAIGALIVAVGTLVVNLLVDDPDPGARSAIGFEVVSAFGTVGLSTGLTGALDAAGQLALALCMLLGRLSVLALAVIIAQGIRTRGGRPPRGVLRVA